MMTRESLLRDKYYKIKKINFIILLMFIFFVGFLTKSITKNNTKKVDVYTYCLLSDNFKEIIDSNFSINYLKKLIIDLKLLHPDIVFAQAVQETGHFKSTIFHENNNLFGMKMAYKRPKTSVGIHKGHAVYKNWMESVLDYALWQQKYANIKNRELYFKHLNDHYAEDPNYSYKLKQIIKNKYYD